MSFCKIDSKPQSVICFKYAVPTESHCKRDECAESKEESEESEIKTQQEK